MYGRQLHSIGIEIARPSCVFFSLLLSLLLKNLWMMNKSTFVRRYRVGIRSAGISIIDTRCPGADIDRANLQYMILIVSSQRNYISAQYIAPAAADGAQVRTRANA